MIMTRKNFMDVVKTIDDYGRDHYHNETIYVRKKYSKEIITYYNITIQTRDESQSMTIDNTEYKNLIYDLQSLDNKLIVIGDFIFKRDDLKSIIISGTYHDYKDSIKYVNSRNELVKLSKAHAASKRANKTTKNNELPETGQTDSSNKATTFGILALLSSIVAFIFGRRAKKKEDK